MRRHPLGFIDTAECSYVAKFYKYNENIIYATASRNTYKYHQTTAHVRMVIYDSVAFVIKADVFDHTLGWGHAASGLGHRWWAHEENGCDETEYEDTLSSEWFDVFKPTGVDILYGQDRDPDVYILTKKIFNNIITDLSFMVLPNDLIELIKEKMYIRVINPGYLEEYPFIVQHIDGLTKRPQYRIVNIWNESNDDNVGSDDKKKWMELHDWSNWNDWNAWKNNDNHRGENIWVEGRHP